MNMLYKLFNKNRISITLKIYIDRMELVYGSQSYIQYPLNAYSSERLLIHDIEMASDCLQKAITKCQLGKRPNIRLIIQPQEMITGGLCDTEVRILHWVGKQAHCNSVEIDAPLAKA